MAQLNITLDEETLKDLMLGNRDEVVRKLLEEVFNTILKMEASWRPGLFLSCKKVSKTCDWCTGLFYCKRGTES